MNPVQGKRRRLHLKHNAEGKEPKLLPSVVSFSPMSRLDTPFNVVRSGTIVNPDEEFIPATSVTFPSVQLN